MRITLEQSVEMLKAAEPLMQWLARNCHPHCSAVVDSTRVELLEGIAQQFTAEYLAAVAANEPKP